MKMLTCLLPVYGYILHRNSAQATIFAPFCNSITHQSIVLENCSNLKICGKYFTEVFIGN